MANLPAWTNNRLIVGFILALFTTVVAVFNRHLPWYVPVITGFAFFALLYSDLPSPSFLTLVVRTGNR